MACCYSNLFNRLSGRVGRVIYYQVGDHLYARAAPGKVKDCRSELQLYYRERMRKTATFYGVIRQTWLARIWQMLGVRRRELARQKLHRGGHGRHRTEKRGRHVERDPAAGGYRHRNRRGHFADA